MVNAVLLHALLHVQRENAWDNVDANLSTWIKYVALGDSSRGPWSEGGLANAMLWKFADTWTWASLLPVRQPNLAVYLFPDVRRPEIVRKAGELSESRGKDTSLGGVHTVHREMQEEQACC